MSDPSLPHRPRFVVVGEALVDVMHYPDGRVAETPGGSPANVAVALGRWGYHPTLLTWLGRDARGERIASWLHESNVTVHPASWGDQPTSSAQARLDATGSVSYVLDLHFAPELPGPLSADLTHVGSTASLVEPGCDVVHQLARTGGLVSYDPNIRPDALADATTSRARVQQLLGLADIVKVSDEDLAWIAPGVDAEAAAADLIASGTSLVALTKGREGAALISSRGRATAASAAQHVVDPVGAGDTMMGALLASLADAGLITNSSERSRAALAALGQAELQHHLTVAQAAAAVTLSRAGADPPWRDEMVIPN